MTTLPPPVRCGACDIVLGYADSMDEAWRIYQAHRAEKHPYTDGKDHSQPPWGQLT